ncbi:hypothetical protein [Cyclobacterium roseum]|uniref:hypothetical protein n=1 Tax=Cyclobacterium roseum TaxID=2666137 RepID=UPI0013918168|nr:hypothetical protein [Cyclobacterium roseum]
MLEENIIVSKAGFFGKDKKLNPFYFPEINTSSLRADTDIPIRVAELLSKAKCTLSPKIKRV